MNILVSLLGSTLDNHGRGEGRWGVWRPSVALAMQEELHFDRYYLLYQPDFRALCRRVEEDIRTCSPDTEVIAEAIAFRDPWDFGEVYSKLYDFSREKNFSAEEHDYYIHITTGTHVAQICLFLLNESHHLPGKLIQTQPTRRNCARGSFTVIDLDLSRYDLLAQRFAVERDNDLDFLKSGIATRNARFNGLIETIERVAIRSTEPILLTGPTGAGKSQLARRIYELKKMNGQLKGSFVDVNCATLRGDQAMSGLFGHKKGAFTGAVSDRAGLLKAADGGILFLDEIGELGSDEQAMLLRAVEEKRFLPLGSDREEGSSFQLICGTNRDLNAEVAAGRFRSDLLARIDLWSFELPGLAERREDIEPNLEYELNRYAEKSGKRVTFNREARKRFLEFALAPGNAWPGNFRDLNAMVTRMATLASGGRIDLETVNREIARASGRHPDAEPDAGLASLLGADYAVRYDLFDLAQLKKVVEICRQSKTLAEAGKKLFAVSRRNKSSSNDSDRLSKYLARFGLDFRTL
ncbi:AAA family ATPase [Victivallaceae bacterium BBE-744-WT-12]|uniref:AAA family ATPase n=1 Tax=Victivallis lenta TaxID=2606640 RepID=A0A844G136_9BACT|nr:RNA repair transcriptional activator RtcR [Victivallis lenta]MST97380.1 AAA family ATPase [Victivallis lenta]